MKVYRGWRTFAPTSVEGGIQNERHTASGTRVVVEVNGQESPLPLRHDLWNKSEEFNWGYGGSGPSQLAMALCSDALGDEIGSHPTIFQRFKDDYVASWQNDWEITEEEIVKWYRNRPIIGGILN